MHSRVSNKGIRKGVNGTNSSGPNLRVWRELVSALCIYSKHRTGAVRLKMTNPADMEEQALKVLVLLLSDGEESSIVIVDRSSELLVGSKRI